MVVEFSKAGLSDPEIIRLDSETKISPLLTMNFYMIKSYQREAALLYVLNKMIPDGQQTIVFVSTRHHCEYLSQLLENLGFDSTIIYSSMDPTARKISIGKFNNKICKILIVTDIAARGIDIPELDNVINYDFPSKPKLFVHRVGRCARNERTGNAISLVSPEEASYMIDLHLFLGIPLQNKLKDDKENILNGYYGKIPDYLIDNEEVNKQISMDSYLVNNNSKTECIKRNK
jgi:ATP-dependent RNA helicase DDX54/DBP10